MLVTFLVTIFLLYAVLQIYTAISTFFRIRKQLSPIPGPNCATLNGDLHLFTNQMNKKLTSEIFYQTLKALAQIYRGESIFKLRFGDKFIVCIFEKEFIKEITSSSTNISKSVEYNFLDRWLGDGLLLASDRDWPRKRNILAKAFHKDALANYAIVFNRKAETFVDELAQDGGYLSMDKTFHFTLDAIAATLLQSELSKKEYETYLACIHRMTKSFTKRALNPVLWNESIFRMTSAGIVYFKSLRAIKKISRRLIENRYSVLVEQQQQQHPQEQDDNEENEKMSEQKSKNKLTKNLLDIILTSTLSMNSKDIDSISDEVDTFLFAGHDTTALTINWCLYRLGRHPDEQASIRDEFRSAKIEPDQMIDFAHLDRLTRLDCFVRECLRLHPPVPVIGRRICKEIRLGDRYTIPSGVMLYVLVDQIHLEANNFVSSHHFMPSRFAKDVQTSSATGYMPFSAGPRNCIGKRFASALIKILLIKLLQRYEIRSDTPLDRIETSYNIVLKPKSPLNVRLCEL